MHPDEIYHHKSAPELHDGLVKPVTKTKTNKVNVTWTEHSILSNGEFARIFWQNAYFKSAFLTSSAIFGQSDGRVARSNATMMINHTEFCGYKKTRAKWAQIFTSRVCIRKCWRRTE